MITGIHKKLFILLTIIMAALLLLVSFIGAFYPPIYAKESLSFSSQGMGQDLFDLFFALPLLLIAAFLALRGKISGLILWGGTAFYLLYSFIIYCFALHFNFLFLAYCALMGSAFYSVLLYITLAKKLNISSRFKANFPYKAMAIFFIISAALFYMTWLKEIIPALMTGSIPQSLITDGLITNPVHILDLALILPGMIIIAVKLLKKQPMGLLLAPIIAVFMVLLCLAIIAMAAMMIFLKTVTDMTMIYIFSVLAVVSLFFCIKMMRNLKP